MKEEIKSQEFRIKEQCPMCNGITTIHNCLTCSGTGYVEKIVPYEKIKKMVLKDYFESIGKDFDTCVQPIEHEKIFMASDLIALLDKIVPNYNERFIKIKIKTNDIIIEKDICDIETSVKGGLFVLTDGFCDDILPKRTYTTIKLYQKLDKLITKIGDKEIRYKICNELVKFNNIQFLEEDEVLYLYNEMEI